MSDLSAQVEAALSSHGGRRRGEEIDFRCVAHDDQKPSASWNRKRNAWHCMTCGEGGSTEHLAELLGIHVERPQERAQRARITAVYDYYHEDGSHAYQIVRMEPKEFRQRYQGADGEWIWKARPHVPYRLRDVMAADPPRVYIVEGEKDADSVVREGGFALTLPAGAQGRDKAGRPGKQRWKPQLFLPYVQGREVVLLPDNDDAGRDLMGFVALALSGQVRALKVLNLPGLGPKGDVSDWLLLGGTLGELERMADEAPAWTPPVDTREVERFGPAGFPETDAGNAELFAHLFGDLVRYDWRLSRWLVWDCHRWAPDATGLLFRYAVEAARARAKAAAELSGDDAKRAWGWAKASESMGKIEAMLKMARALPPIADAGEGWDANPLLLGCTNGVVNLATGELRPGRREDRVTKSVQLHYAPGAPCPRWEQFMVEVFPDAAVREYVRVALGYALTGSTREQIWFLCHGTGANGKSVLLDTVRRVAGDYGHVMAFSTIEKGKQQSIPADMAALAGRRVVTVSEAGEYARVNEERVKGLTGDDPVTARELYKPQFTFVPELKLFVAVNHKPEVRDGSEGYWRRIRNIPFEATFGADRRDPHLKQKLRDEAEGILAWAVRAAADWHAKGLPETPAAIAVATVEYRDESDPLAGFITECCVTVAHALVGAADLYKAYREWCTAQGWSGSDVMSGTMFGRRVGERFRRAKNQGRMQYRGVGLKCDNWYDNTTQTLPSGDSSRFGDSLKGINSQAAPARGIEFPQNPPNPPYPPLACNCDETHDSYDGCGEGYWDDANGEPHCLTCHPPEGGH